MCNSIFRPEAIYASKGYYQRLIFAPILYSLCYMEESLPMSRYIHVYRSNVPRRGINDDVYYEFP